MTFDEVRDEILKKGKFATRSGFEIFSELQVLLENPAHNMNIIHVAGTNGKGSTVAFISSILKAAGFCVGRYTSPHLVSVCERIALDSEAISENDFVVYGTKILEICRQNNLEVTSLDILLGIALLYFDDCHCDYVILETGMGGTNDSTNAIDTIPLVSVITRIGMDHTQYLGTDIASITQEKAGILKKGTHAVFAQNDTLISHLLQQRAQQLDIEYIDLTNAPENIASAMHGEKLGLLGMYQFENAQSAVCCVLILFELSHKSNSKLWNIWEKTNLKECIHQGLMNVTWPGRMQIVSKNPWVMVDGAHNPQGVLALVHSLSILYPQEKFIFVTGIFADKDHGTMIKEIVPYVYELYVTSMDEKRYVSAEELYQEALSNHIPCKIYASLDEAIVKAKESALRQNIKCIVFGSLALVGIFEKEE